MTKMLNKIYRLGMCMLGTLLWAQQKYEAFGVNNKYGIAEIQNMQEYEAPNYDKINLFVTDYMVLQNGDKVSFYSKETGEKITLDKDKTMWQSVYLNNHKYEHYQDANKSYLIPDQFKNRVMLPRKYSNILSGSFKEGRKYIVAVHHHKLDVYKSPDVTKPLIKDMKASDYFTDFYTKVATDEVKLLHIFYGEGTVSLYDENLKLIKSYKGNTTGLGDTNDLIEKDYKQVLKPPQISNIIAGDFWWKAKYSDGKTKIWNRRNPVESFVVKGNYGVWDVKNNDQWIELKSEDRTKKYQFRVDMEHQRILLPQKYQEELLPEFSK